MCWNLLGDGLCFSSRLFSAEQRQHAVRHKPISDGIFELLPAQVAELQQVEDQRNAGDHLHEVDEDGLLSWSENSNETDLMFEQKMKQIIQKMNNENN